MADQFIGEIRVVPFNFAPHGWALCNGQLMAISQNTALFSLLGTFYGGNGTSNFALPNLQGRTALSQGNGLGLTARIVGEDVGSSAVTLTTNQIPSHTHSLSGTSANATTESPSTNLLAHSAREIYQSVVSGTPMSTLAIQGQGGNQPHENRQPFLVMSYIIALTGIFPPRG